LVRLRGFQELTPIDQALRVFFESFVIKKPHAESVPLDLALHRVLARPIIAEESIPCVNRSAVDGYAVKAEFTTDTRQSKPKIMELTNMAKVGPGQAKRLWTGNPIPKGSDAVVMLENTKEFSGKVEVGAQVTPWENVSRIGEDIRKGTVALEAGTRLRPQHIGLIAALGIPKVKVFKRPDIAVLATGGELVEPSQRKPAEKIFNANSHVVSAMCRELGANPLDLGIVGDDAAQIKEKLRMGLASDAIITSGGTSVGAPDLVPDAVNMLGKPGVIVHGIAMRPGMPAALAAVRSKPIVILPGNPVAVMVGFEVFARTLIFRLLGLKHGEPRPTLEAVMGKKISTALGRRTFVRVRVSRKGDKYSAEPISARGSSLISTMTRSNGFVVVPEYKEGLAEGEIVTVHMFAEVEEAVADV
jgi:molybdopterin molybdotransferase